MPKILRHIALLDILLWAKTRYERNQHFAIFTYEIYK